MNLFNRQRQASAEGIDGAESLALLSPLERLRQRTKSDEAGLFSAEQDACAAALTLARRWGELHRRGECGIVVASGGRFDRLIESMAADVSRVPFNDLSAMEAAVDSRTVAIILEPIQGSSVVTPASHAYLQGVERLCRALNILLILNEARGPIGQHGGVLCEDSYGVRADIVVLGDHSNRCPRSPALLVRGQACAGRIDQLPGFVPEPVSSLSARRPPVITPLLTTVFDGLMA
ncbi:aminotransferase class III-fold pyridoxal phosphate-dependent enzyme [Pseudomonas sp. NPDC088368]|jgi:acetylornithine/N-succinyldiaminopimelate aminotransferase|uniref:aminotransferase class III-fold pyridoxal phosphate-dependent enzyme n=1 Tax=Pseudomonas sp. NPDC088368 TaxID=3364453 RepID=UPI003805A947